MLNLRKRKIATLIAVILGSSMLTACGGGDDGSNGLNGANGASGLDGTNGTNGVNGSDGANGTAGTNGTNGQNLTATAKLTRLAASR
jgi:hypothetical protein